MGTVLFVAISLLNRLSVGEHVRFFQEVVWWAVWEE